MKYSNWIFFKVGIKNFTLIMLIHLSNTVFNIQWSLHFKTTYSVRIGGLLENFPQTYVSSG